MTATALTVEQQFDIIAPIVICLQADLMFKKQAQVAMRKLKRNPELFAKAGSPDSLDDFYPTGFYNDLFKDVVLSLKPNWTPFVDRWGAKGFKDETGAVVFSGDDTGFYPWYETAALIAVRVSEH